jgi:hypothetical protein
MMSTSALSFNKKEPEFKTPRQIVPVWSDTVLHQPGEPATRGFGGRLMFYGEDKHKPILVDGSLVVYAWDDGKGTMERAPDRKYVFPSDKIQSHYSESRLGHSYSFWVPWDAAGGGLTHLTLISRFVSNDGTEITSSPAHVVLQGPSKSSPFPNEIARKSSTGGIQRVGYEVSADDILSGKDIDDSTDEASRSSLRRNRSLRKHPGLQTSEIDLTSGFFDRNMRGAAGSNNDGASVIDAQDLLKSPPVDPTSASSTNLSGSRAAAKTSNAAAMAAETEERYPPSARLQPFESRGRASRAAQLSGDHVRKEPLPAKWLNGLPETPRSSPSETE